uniref:Uncharacterized protein n=1 Tax=Oryza brachyantha TaxID=4533 RepID=J3M3E3_ORYBR
MAAPLLCFVCSRGRGGRGWGSAAALAGGGGTAAAAREEHAMEHGPAADEVSSAAPTISPCSHTSVPAGSGGIPPPPPSDGAALAPTTPAFRVVGCDALLRASISTRWFLFGDAHEPYCPALLAACCAVALDDTRPDGFSIAGPGLEAFAVSSDVGLGLSLATPDGEILWCSFLSTADDDAPDTVARVPPLPAGPYLVHSTRRCGRWRVFVRTASSDDASLAPPSSPTAGIHVYAIGRGSRLDLAKSLQGLIETTDDGSYSDRYERVFVQSGHAWAGYWRTSVHVGGTATASSSAPCSTVVNPCGCPEWQNRRGFAVPVLPLLPVPEDCVVEGAMTPPRPVWQMFYARRTGPSEVYHAFFRVQDVVHRNDAVLWQLYIYDMDDDEEEEGGGGSPAPLAAVPL